MKPPKQLSLLQIERTKAYELLAMVRYENGLLWFEKDVVGTIC